MFVIIALFIFGIAVFRGLFILAEYLDERERERAEFYMALAKDLERLDKMIAQGNKPQPKEPRITRWAGRN